ncbi:MAG: 50S ribosomal protein L10 [Halobacteriovoraceae bacterium]|jgi:large subunit ribosomal protein L10|nr:50S ribosomal protein L10 [Halobacteriovoraceae bacterium]|tara:strand:- start:12151 stop:12702 length:552 start_codon:yes stop_codon:yes gene_type:complete
MLKRAEKDEIISGLKQNIENAKAVFLTNLIGIGANDAVSLRKEIRESDGKIVVTRNTLFKKAAEGTPVESILGELKGPHALAFAFDDAAAVAKALKEAGKEHEAVELKGGVLNGEVLDLEQVKALADLPSRDEMLGTLLATFMAPVSAFARLTNSIKDECETQGVETPGALKVEKADAEEAEA